MSDDEEYKKKRERNNKSVQKCRENEKKKVQQAKEQLEQFKKENKDLESKCSNLEKELQVLKSLFRAPADNDEAKEETPTTSKADQVSLSQESNLNNKTELNKQKIYLNKAKVSRISSDDNNKHSDKNSQDFDLVDSNINNNASDNQESSNKRFKKIEMPKHHEYGLRKKFGN